MKTSIDKFRAQEKTVRQRDSFESVKDSFKDSFKAAIKEQNEVKTPEHSSPNLPPKTPLNPGAPLNIAEIRENFSRTYFSFKRLPLSDKLKRLKALSREHTKLLIISIIGFFALFPFSLVAFVAVAYVLAPEDDGQQKH